jgi:hypothetical protein
MIMDEKASATTYLIAHEEEQEDRDFDTGFVSDQTQYRPIVGGIRIRGQKSEDFDRSPSFGTLGCFAVTTGDDSGQRVLLTNFHVLEDPHHELNGPSCTGCTKGDAVGNPNVGSQIATVLRGLNKDKDMMDAAIAVLDKGVLFNRDVVKDDAPGQREVITGTRNVTQADKGLRVHKRGHRTRLTYGILGDVGKSATIAGKTKQNQIHIDLPEKVAGARLEFKPDHTLVAPDVDLIAAGVQQNDVAWVEGIQNRGRYRITAVRQHEIDIAGEELEAAPPVGGGLYVTPPNFALRGDSGSVLLDDDGKVIGLIWAARALRQGNAIATPISVVETGLRIKIDAATVVGDTQTALRSGGTRAAAQGIDTPSSAPALLTSSQAPSLREQVEQDLLALPRGQQIYQLYFKHHMEVRELIDGNRRVALVWHRQGGPGMIQSVVDAVRSTTSPVAASIRGRSWGERASAILEVFRQFGSPRLRDDVAMFGRDIEALGGLTYTVFLKSLEG